MYMGAAVLQQAYYVTSEMQQGISRLCVQDIVDANTMLKELYILVPFLTFPKPTGLSSIAIRMSADASHPNTIFYGQTRMLLAYGAEILSAAYADDRGLYSRLN